MPNVATHQEHYPSAAPFIAPPQARITKIAQLQTGCTTCRLRELCLPCGLVGGDAARVEDLIYTRKRLKRGVSLYRAGDPFTSLYALRNGFF